MPRKSRLALVEPPSWPQDVEHDGEHILVVGRWFFLVASKSEKDCWHVVDLEGVEGEAGHCTCRSNETRKTCRHEAAVRFLCQL